MSFLITCTPFWLKFNTNIIFVGQLIISKITYNFRHLAIDYLHPMTPNRGGIFVKRTSFLEGVDYQVFIRPFKKWTWVMLIVSSFVMAFFTVAVWKILNHQKITLRYSIKIAITSFQTNFGFGNFHSLPNIGMVTPKVIALISLLLGNVIWLSYNGSLLSGLIEPKVIKPFYDLESLSKTNFRFNFPK